MPWHWHKNRLPSRVGIIDVYSVTTISEVSKLWYLSRTAILYARQPIFMPMPRHILSHAPLQHL